MPFANSEGKLLKNGCKNVSSLQIVLQNTLNHTMESLLKDRKHQYRSCQIMNRFKIVHYYAKSSDTVHVVDIWDMLMNPEKQQ